MLRSDIRKIEGRHRYKEEMIRMRIMSKDTEKCENRGQILKKGEQTKQDQQQNKTFKAIKTKIKNFIKICKSALKYQQAAICNWFIESAQP